MRDRFTSGYVRVRPAQRVYFVTMFWRFGFHTDSNINTILDKDDFTLEEVMLWLVRILNVEVQLVLQRKWDQLLPL